MAENTTTVEGIDFRAADVNASAVADKIGHSFHKLHEVTERAREKLGEFSRHAATGALASIGLGFGLRSVFEKATEANSELARVTKNVAGAQYAFQGWKGGLSSLDKMNYAMRQGADVAEELHARGLRLRAPIDEMAEAYNQVAAVGFGRLGMSQKGVLDLTEKITAAAKVYGISGGEAISTVNRALITGRIRGISPFAIAMQEAIGQTAGKKSQHLSPDKLMERMSKSMGDMVPAAQRMGQNMQGSIFEAKMLVDEMLRDLTGPMFKQQTQSLSEWVTKLREVRENGKSIMQVYGAKLAGAFQSLKSATAFIVDHWKSLLAIYASSKLATTLSGYASRAGGEGKAGIAGALGGAGTMNITAGTVNVNGAGAAFAKTVSKEMTATLRPTMSDTIGGLAGLAGKAMIVTEALGGLYLAADGLAKWVDFQQDEWLSRGRNAAGLLSSVQAFERSVNTLKKGGLWSGEHALTSMRTAFEQVGLKPGQAMTAEGVGDLLSGLPSDVAVQMVNKLSDIMPNMVHKTTVGGIETAPQEIGREIATAMNEYMGKLAQAYGAEGAEFNPNTPNTNWKVPGPGNINIQNLTITQDFKEADPDRVFHKVSAEISAIGHGNSRFNNAAGI